MKEKLTVTLLYLLTLLGCSPAYSKEPMIAHRDGKAVLLADISSTITREVTRSIAKASELLPDGSEINLTINSAGGDFEATKELVRSLRRRLTLSCLVDGLAASAAYYLLLHCDKRYVTPGSIFSFHWIVVTYSMEPPADVYVINLFELNQEQAAWDGIGEYVTGLDATVYKELRHRMRLSAEELYRLSPRKWFSFVNKTEDVVAKALTRGGE